MKRQRSKAELLAYMRTYAALKKEERDGTELNKKVSYWRMGVEWGSVLWKEEKWSANEIAKLLQYVNAGKKSGKCSGTGWTGHCVIV